MIRKIMNYFGYISKTTFNLIQNEHLKRIDFLSNELSNTEKQIEKMKKCCIENDKLKKEIKDIEAKLFYLKNKKQYFGLSSDISTISSLILKGEQND